MTKNQSMTLILILFIYLLIFILMPAKGFWIVDNGNKYIQMRALSQNHFSSSAISWAGEKVDPQHTLNPLPNPFSVVKDNKLYSIFPPFFSALSSPFFTAFGTKGIYIIPLLSGLAILLGILYICRWLGFTDKQKMTVLWLSAFATPVLFYSFTFWEHTLAVCLVIWAIYQALIFKKSGRIRNLAASFCLSGLAIYFRDELFVFALVLALVVLHGHTGNRIKIISVMAAAFILTLLPLFLGQYWLSGMPLGAHLSKHLTAAKGVVVHITDRPQVIYNLFLALFSPKSLASLLVLSYLITIAGHFFLAKRWQKTMANIYTFILIIHSVMLLLLLFDGRILSKLIDANSLFAASPFLLFLFLQRRQGEKQSPIPAGVTFIGRVAVGFALVYLAAAPKAGSSGIHWGCRFLLLLYPLLTILLVHKYRDKINKILNLRNLSLAVVVALSLFLQIASLHLLYQKKSFDERLNHFVAQQSEKVIITNIWHAPQDLAFNFNTKIIFYFKGRRQMPRINQVLKQYKERGHRSILFISPAVPASQQNYMAQFKFRDSPIFSFQIKSINL